MVVGLSDYPSIFYVMVAAALASAALPLRTPVPEPPAVTPADMEAAEEAAT